jgi:hypothetical protein
VVNLSADATKDIVAGPLLAAFAQAVVRSGPDAELAAARGMLLAALGDGALGEAAGVVAFFNAINRVADATGVAVPQLWVEASRVVAPEVDFDHTGSESTSRSARED